MPAERMSRRRWVAVATVAALAAALALGVVLFARGGGPVPAWLGFLAPTRIEPLEPSGPAEQVMRTVRLAGFERAVVGDSGGTALVRLELPATNTAADVELAWQTGAAALAAAYPDEHDYVVQVFDGPVGLLEVAWDGDEARSSISSGDAGALRGAGAFTFLGEETGDE